MNALTIIHQYNVRIDACRLQRPAVFSFRCIPISLSNLQGRPCINVIFPSDESASPRNVSHVLHIILPPALDKMKRSTKIKLFLLTVDVFNRQKFLYLTLGVYLKSSAAIPNTKTVFLAICLPVYQSVCLFVYITLCVCFSAIPNLHAISFRWGSHIRHPRWS